jgi:hypothetical protein
MTFSSLYSESIYRDYDKAEYEYMDSLAVSAGTDKSSLFHNYTKVYSQYFSKVKDAPIKFLEIGIFKGNSFKFWEKYFTQADLHFIDITNQYIQYYSKRSKYHYMDQSNIRQLREFGAEHGMFDVILDDGGHTMNQQIASFIALFPFVKSGGLYIIEDLHTSYWHSYNGSGDNGYAGEGTAVGYLKNLVDHVNYPGAVSECADINKLTEEQKEKMNYLRDNIESIRFYTSVCIIEKK